MNTFARRPTVSSRGRINTGPTPSTVRWNTFVGAPTHHDGGDSPATLSKSNVYGSGPTTRTRACPVTLPTVALTRPPSPRVGRLAAAEAVNVPLGAMVPVSCSTAHVAFWGDS